MFFSSSLPVGWPSRQARLIEESQIEVGERSTATGGRPACPGGATRSSKARVPTLEIQNESTHPYLRWPLACVARERRISNLSPLPAGCGPALDATNYPNSEVQPHVASDPNDPLHLVAVYQQDRWSTMGGNGQPTTVSDDLGLRWRAATPAPFTACTGGTDENGGNYELATDATRPTSWRQVPTPSRHDARLARPRGRSRLPSADKKGRWLLARSPECRWVGCWRSAFDVRG